MPSLLRHPQRGGCRPPWPSIRTSSDERPSALWTARWPSGSSLARLSLLPWTGGRHGRSGAQRPLRPPLSVQCVSPMAAAAAATPWESSSGPSRPGLHPLLSARRHGRVGSFRSKFKAALSRLSIYRLTSCYSELAGPRRSPPAPYLAVLASLGTVWLAVQDTHSILSCGALRTLLESGAARAEAIVLLTHLIAALPCRRCARCTSCKTRGLGGWPRREWGRGRMWGQLPQKTVLWPLQFRLRRARFQASFGFPVRPRSRAARNSLHMMPRLQTPTRRRPCAALCGLRSRQSRLGHRTPLQ